RDHRDRISNNPPTEMLLRSLVLTMKAQTERGEYADISDQVGGFSVQMTPVERLKRLLVIRYDNLNFSD
ncbi:MAG TPA: hypothetical protein PLI03_12085, partial [Chitinophagales bacterium]|nr:hypothetical protein [Chitinophagales bacterium]